MRGVVTPPRRRALTQGMIFAAAVAEDFPGVPVSGLIVTARCDIAQGRVATYHYIPVVRLRDWLTVVAPPLIKERVSEGVLKALRSVLKKAGHPENSIELGSLDEVMNSFFPEGIKDLKSYRTQFQAQLARLEKVRPCAGIDQFISEFPGEVSTLVNEIVGNRLTGYFFLEKIEPKGEDHGYVVLLREITKLPRALAVEIEDGFDKERFDRLCSDYPYASSLFCFDCHDYCMPQSQVSSPYIEQLMQAFANLFARIGVEDLKKEYIEGLLARQQLTKAADQ